MMSMLKKLKQKIHWICNYIKLNPKLQFALYGIAAVIVLTIFIMLSLAPFLSSEDFVTYKTKTCFRKHNLNITTPSEINYAEVGNMLIMTYDFEQKCYDDMKVEHTIVDKNIDIIVKTLGINDDCFCLSKVTAKIGPIIDSNYTVNVYKEADENKYLVNSKNFT